MDFHTAWHFLTEHPIFKESPHEYAFTHFDTTMWIDVVKVNPINNHVEDDAALNTVTRVWVEQGPWITTHMLPDTESGYLPQGCSSHDYRLDSGGATFEEAIIQLAKKVRYFYGVDGTERRTKKDGGKPKPRWTREDYKTAGVPIPRGTKLRKKGDW